VKKTLPVVTLIRQGKTVAEKAATRRSLTVGRHWGADLLDPHCGVERERILTRSLGGSYVLHLPEKATALFSRGSSRLPLESMVAWGLATRGRKGFSISFRPGMTAEFSLAGDDFRVEFGEAPASAVPSAVSSLMPLPTGRVPRQYRFTPPPAEDRLFGILMGSLLTFAAVSLFLLRQIPLPPPGVIAIEKMPARISKLLLQAPAKPKPVTPPLVAPVAGATESRGGTAEKAPAAEAPRVEGPKVAAAAGEPGGGGAGAGANRAAARAKVSNMGVLGLLSGKGTAGRSGARSRAVTALQLDASLEQNLDQVLSEVKGITVAGGGGEGEGPGGGGTGTGSGGAGAELIGIGRQVQGAVGAPVRVARLGTIKGSPVAASGSAKALEPEQREERSSRTIARVVDSHTGAIRYAYNKELRKNPALKGKIVLRFTIAADGTVTDARLEESTMNWAPLETALADMAVKWKFPPIPEGVVAVTYPFIFFPSM
jgi:TonB family protein